MDVRLRCVSFAAFFFVLSVIVFAFFLLAPVV
jgi:hypothetical protein